MPTRSKHSNSGAPRDYATIARRYCAAVVAGKQTAGALTIAACARHLNDLKRARAPGFPFVFDRKRASRACRFIEALPHVQGEWSRQRMRITLEPWQIFVVASVFGWVYRATGLRRFRRVYLEVARKNAKSTLSSGIGLYGLVADDEAGAEVYSLATSRDQASIVWQWARQMVLKSPGMRRRFNVKAGAKAIYVPTTNSTFVALPRDPGDGKNPSVAIVDEYHQHKTPVAYDAMYAGQGARAQPLMWVITTAGTNRGGPCFAMRTYSQKVLQGVIKDDSLFTAIYAIDENDDVFDSRVWIKANPNLNVSVSYSQLEEAVNEARENSARMATLLAKRFNRWVSSFSAWLNMLKWDACAEPALRLSDYEGRTCYIALDLASKIDVAAMALLFPEDDGRVTVFGRYYLPEDAVRANAQSTHAHFAAWESDGWITLTPGNVIDYAYIKQDLREFSTMFDVREVAFDPWQATQLATEMLAEGAPMVEVPNTVKHFSPAMKELEAMVYARRLRHNGDPVLAWMVSNVVARLDAKDNIYPRKELPENKIDGIVAVIMGLARLTVQESDGGRFDDYIRSPLRS